MMKIEFDCPKYVFTLIVYYLKEVMKEEYYNTHTNPLPKKTLMIIIIIKNKN